MDKQSKKYNSTSPDNLRKQPVNPNQVTQNISKAKKTSKIVTDTSTDVLKIRVDLINQSLKKTTLKESIPDDEKIKKSYKNDKKIIKMHIDNTTPAYKPDNKISEQRVSRCEVQSRPIDKRSSSIPVCKDYIDANVTSMKENTCVKLTTSVQRVEINQKPFVDSIIEDQFSNASTEEDNCVQKISKMKPLLEEMSQLSISSRDSIYKNLGRGMSKNQLSLKQQSPYSELKDTHAVKKLSIQSQQNPLTPNNQNFQLTGRGKLLYSPSTPTHSLNLELNNLNEKQEIKSQETRDTIFQNLGRGKLLNPHTPTQSQNSSNIFQQLGRGKLLDPYKTPVKLQNSGINLTPRNVDKIKIEPCCLFVTEPNTDEKQDLSKVISFSYARGRPIPQTCDNKNINYLGIKTDSKITYNNFVQNIESQPEKITQIKFLRPGFKEINEEESTKVEKITEISKKETEEVLIQDTEILESPEIQVGSVETKNKCTNNFDDVKNWIENLETNYLKKSSSSSSLSSTDENPLEVNKLSSSFESDISEEETDELQESVLAIESLERLKRVDGILHGKTQIKLVTTFNDLPLNSLIHNNLRFKKLTNLSRCQVFSIPVILEKKNFVLVGLPKSKKTTSYVVPLLSNLLDEEYYFKLKEGNGPRGIIIVPNAHRVRHVASLCSSFSGARVNIITTHGGGLELERKDELTNGCDLLISTPRCWLRLLNLKHVTNILRLCHIVFDSFDDLSSLFLEELMDIYGRITDLEKYRKSSSIKYPVQKVFVGQTWNSVLEKIVFQFLKNPVLCITAHLEAAVYAKVHPELIITDKEDKIHKFTELINKKEPIKTVVICNTADEVKKIRPFLSTCKLNVIFAHEDMHGSLLQDAKNSWMCNPDKSMLVCSDDVVMELAITNADWLIHYTIPENKSLFSDRFCVLKEHFSDRLLNPKTGVTCKVHLLVDDTNEIQFPELLRFIERFNFKALSNLKNAVQKIEENKEKNKTNVLLCDKLLQFGQCWKKQSCQKQHIIDLHRDKPCISMKGYILFKLISVNNATCFSARIISIAKNIADLSEIKWEHFHSDYSRIGLIMMKSFRDVEKRRLHGRPKVGDKIAAQKPGSVFFSRGQILAITGRNDKFDPTEVFVWFMDDGPKIIIKVEDIYELPQSAYHFPPQTVDLYVANLHPIDLDVNWSYMSTKIIKHKLNKTQTKYKSLFHIGKVDLVIGSNLIVDDFCLYEKLEISQCYVTRFSIKKYMLKSRMALYSPKHVASLKDLCVQGCLIEPEIQMKKVELDKVSSDKAKWAHMPKDELLLVNIVFIQTPSLFYVQIHKFHKMLEELHKDLSNALEKNAKPLKLVKIGSLCAIKDKINQWNRASVIKINSDNTVEVLFVDYGDIIKTDISQLFVIPESLITRLPFQAIECELCGVTPIMNKWSRESTKFLRSISENEFSLKNLYLKVCDIKTKACVTNGKHYSVILAHHDDARLFVNVEMVSNAFARYNNSTKHYLDEALEHVKLMEEKDQIDENLNDSAEDWEEEDLADTQNLISVNSRIENHDIFKQFKENFEIINDKRRYNLDLENLELYLSDCENSMEDDDDDLPPPIDYVPKCSNISSDIKSCKESDYDSKSSLCESDIDDEIPQLELAAKIYTPTVFWREDDTFVWIKIMIPDVKFYKINYNRAYLTFQAHIKEKIYWLAIDFFGLTEKKGFMYKITGQHVAIRLEKMIKYHNWIRLTYLEAKSPHIKIDPQYGLHEFSENWSNEDNSFFNLDDVSHPITEPDRRSESDHSILSDVQEFDVTPYDEYDPLA